MTAAVLVSLTGDEQIKLYDLDPQSGALTLRATSPAHGPSGALVFHPNSQILYDAHVGSSTLAAFRFDAASGAFSLINKVDTGITIPAHQTTDAAGRFLLTAYYGSGGITVHRLEEDGAIGEQLQYVDTGEKAHAILRTDENFVFVPHVCPNNRTAQFSFDPDTGQLAANEPDFLPPPTGEPGPRHICFRPANDIAYIVNEQGNTVTVHRYDKERGTLEIIQDITTLPADHADGATAHVEVHPNGKWCYASNRGHDSVVGYDIAEDGILTPFGHYPIPASPRSFNIDPSGTFLYGAGEAAGVMRSYRIDQNSGALEPLEDYEVGQQPFWVMVKEIG